MKMKQKRIFGKLLYSEYALALGAFVTMGMWALFWNVFPASYVLLLFPVMTMVSDKVLYVYSSQLEQKMRLLIVEDSRLVPKHIETERLYLRELQLSDQTLIQDLSKDQQIVRFVKDIDSNMKKNEARRWIVEHMQLERKALRTTRVFVEKESKMPLGAVVFINGHELEYWTLKNYRYKGITYEAVQSMLNHIEKEDNIVLFAKTHKDNIASIQFLRKNGFIQEFVDEHEQIHWLYKSIVKESH